MKSSISSADFSEIFNHSRSVSCNKILFKVYKKNIADSVVGFAINKKLGHAQKRNLFKRRARSLFDSTFIKNNKKIAMIIIPKTINLEWNNMCDSFKLLEKKLYDE